MINKLLNINLLNFLLFIGTLFSFLLWEFASVIAPSKIYINNFFKFSLILFLPLCFLKFKKIKLLILFSIIFFLQEILIKYYHNIENYSNLRHYFSIFFFLSFIIVVKKFHKKIFIYTINKSARGFTNMECSICAFFISRN